MKRKLPTTISLQCFDAVAQHLNMTYAGDALHLTQSAVSRQIKNLETFIGRQLFYRQDNQLSLTPVGEQYAEEVHRLLNNLDVATQKVMIDTYPSKSIVLKVVTEPSLAMRWLMPRLTEFYLSFPDIEVDLSTDFHPAMRNARKYDLAILWGRREDWADYSTDYLRKDSYVAVATPRLMKGKTAAKTMLEVLNFPFLHQSHSLSVTYMWLTAAGLTDKEIAMLHGQHFDHMIYLLQAVLNHLGVSIFPEYLVAEDLASGKLVLACDEKYTPVESFYVITAVERQDEYAIRHFRKWLMSHKEPC